MTDESFEQVLLQPRKTISMTYSGSRSGLGKASRLLYSWVGTYYADRIGDVWVCFADRAAFDAGPNDDVQAEVRFDPDETFNERSILPEGLAVRSARGEALVVRYYEGPLTEMKDAVRPWLEQTPAQIEVAPGFRQRMVRMAKKPTDPDWAVELALVRR